MSTLTKPRARKRRELTAEEKHDEARRLWRLTGGMVDVTYCAGMFVEGDRDAQGHIYYGNWQPPESPADDGDTFYMDDREGPLELQLAAELRRVAGCFIATARKLESEASHV